MTLREVLHQDRVGPHLGPVLDGDRPQDLGAGADLHVVTDGGVALARTHRHPAQSHSVEQQHVVADLRGLTDDHAHAVVDEEALTDRRGRVDLDTGEVAGRLRQGTRREAIALVPQLVSRPVRPQGVDTRVEEGHLHAGAGGWVALAGRRQVLTGQVQKGPLGVVHSVLL